MQEKAPLVTHPYPVVTQLVSPLTLQAESAVAVVLSVHWTTLQAPFAHKHLLI